MKNFFTDKQGNWSKRKIIFSAFLVVMLIAVIVFGKMYGDFHSTIGKIQQNISVKNIREKKVSVKDGEPLNILLLGTDDDSLARKSEEGYVSRSDTLMVVSINPQKHSTKLLSIPRDTYTMIKGQDGPDKINHAYAFGGVELSIDTVQNYLNIPIDYYAVVNMNGLSELVDAVGGIEVKSPLTFEYRGTRFKKGETRKLNGVKAMNFARMRYDDPEGEMGRQSRQKIVIKALVDKILSMDAVTNYPRILKVVSKNMKTNFDMASIMNIYQQYIPAMDQISSVKFESLEDLYVDEIFYFYIPMSSRMKVANELRQHSGMAPITVADLVDPLEEDSPTFAKAATIVMNQYPTGISQEQMDAIIANQNSVQEIRSSEYYVPPTVPQYNNGGYTPPETWTPPVSPQPPETGIVTNEPTVPVPEAPVEPVPTEPVPVNPAPSNPPVTPPAPESGAN